MNEEKKPCTCGECKCGEVQPDGSYCRCKNDGMFHKCNDTVCNEQKGGKQ